VHDTRAQRSTVFGAESRSQAPPGGTSRNTSASRKSVRQRLRVCGGVEVQLCRALAARRVHVEEGEGSKCGKSRGGRPRHAADRCVRAHVSSLLYSKMDRQEGGTVLRVCDRRRPREHARQIETRIPSRAYCRSPISASSRLGASPIFSIVTGLMFVGICRAASCPSSRMIAAQRRRDAAEKRLFQIPPLTTRRGAATASFVGSHCSMSSRPCLWLVEVHHER